MEVSGEMNVPQELDDHFGEQEQITDMKDCQTGQFSEEELEVTVVEAPDEEVYASTTDQRRERN